MFLPVVLVLDEKDMKSIIILNGIALTAVFNIIFSLAYKEKRDYRSFL